MAGIKLVALIACLVASVTCDYGSTGVSSRSGARQLTGGRHDGALGGGVGVGPVGFSHGRVPPPYENPWVDGQPRGYGGAEGTGFSAGHGGGYGGGHGGGYEGGYGGGHGAHEQSQPYQFGYAVKDYHTGNDFKQQEHSDGNTVKGQYRVLLPDGRTQIVTYTADWQTGFHADVKYEGQAVYPTNYGQGGGSTYGVPPVGGGGGGGYGGGSSYNTLGGGSDGHYGGPSSSYGPPGYHK